MEPDASNASPQISQAAGPVPTALPMPRADDYDFTVGVGSIQPLKANR